MAKNDKVALLTKKLIADAENVNVTLNAASAT
jgi:hypothetical protein